MLLKDTGRRTLILKWGFDAGSRTAPSLRRSAGLGIDGDPSPAQSRGRTFTYTDREGELRELVTRSLPGVLQPSYTCTAILLLPTEVVEGEAPVTQTAPPLRKAAGGSREGMLTSASPQSYASVGAPPDALHLY